MKPEDGKKRGYTKIHLVQLVLLSFMRPVLTTEEIKSAFKQIAESMDASKILINVTGGEPLVRQDLCEVMEYASKELGFHWGMTTNGILLNEKNIEKLKNANMESISVSIDGLQETHDEFRGVPGSYEKYKSITRVI